MQHSKRARSFEQYGVGHVPSELWVVNFSEWGEISLFAFRHDEEFTRNGVEGSLGGEEEIACRQ